MKKGSTHILRGVIILIGLAVLGLCIFALPIGLRSDATGYYQPIILGMYVASIPFFYGLYKTLTLLSFIDRKVAFSEMSIEALKKIKYCAYTICGIYLLGMPYIFVVADKDDAPGVAAIGFLLIGISLVVGAAAAVLQSLLQNAAEIKYENDMTV